MFPKEFADKNTRSTAFLYTAKRLGINVAIVEKDFWVSEVLEFLFGVFKYKDALLFKGGTSLSKCFHLINRFSEDVDISINWGLFSFSKSPDLFAQLSQTKRRKFNDAARNETRAFVSGPFLAELVSGLKDKLGFEPSIVPDQTEPMTLVFNYPRSFENRSIKPAVIIETGSLSATGPSLERMIEPLVAFDFPSLFAHPSFSVRCMDPRRVFWEKITILYQEAQRPIEKSMPLHYSRHYYDVFQLKRSEYFENAINSRDILEDVVKMKQTFYPNSWMNYIKSLTKMTIVPPRFRINELKKDYQLMSQMIYEQVPSLNDILLSLGEVERLIAIRNNPVLK